MLTSRRQAGLFGFVSLANLLLLFSLLLFVNSVTAAPLQLRGGSSGSTFCNVPLKANHYYRNVCLGLLDPQTGSKSETLPQPGVASIGTNLLRWQTSKDMGGILNNPLVDRSSIHCDHVLEIQTLKRTLKLTESWATCKKLTDAGALISLQKVINGKGNLRLLDGEVNKLKGRYTTRILTAKYGTKKRGPKALVLPVLQDQRLSQGINAYLSVINTNEFKMVADTASQVWEVLDSEIPGILGPSEEKFVQNMVEDFLTLQSFFKTWARATQGDHGPLWAPAGGEFAGVALTADEIEIVSQADAQDVMDLEGSFSQDDENESLGDLDTSSSNLGNEVGQAVLSQAPPVLRILRNGKVMTCNQKRLDSDNSTSQDSVACELPSRTKQQPPMDSDGLQAQETTSILSSSLFPGTQRLSTLPAQVPLSASLHVGQSSLYVNRSSPTSRLLADPIPTPKSGLLTTSRVLVNTVSPKAFTRPVFLQSSTLPIQTALGDVYRGGYATLRVTDLVGVGGQAKSKGLARVGSFAPKATSRKIL